MFNLVKKNALYLALIIAFFSVTGSLYFSEILQIQPCFLCWWQRIFMYPLAIILIVGIVRRNKDVYQYALPFAVIGAFIALYHVLLYSGIIPEALAPCTVGVSCVEQKIIWFGFLTIPLMSLASFVLISILLFLTRNNIND